MDQSFCHQPCDDGEQPGGASCATCIELSISRSHNSVQLRGTGRVDGANLDQGTEKQRLEYAACRAVIRDPAARHILDMVFHAACWALMVIVSPVEITSYWRFITNHKTM